MNNGGIAFYQPRFFALIIFSIFIKNIAIPTFEYVDGKFMG